MLFVLQIKLSIKYYKKGPKYNCLHFPRTIKVCVILRTERYFCLFVISSLTYILNLLLCYKPQAANPILTEKFPNSHITSMLRIDHRQKQININFIQTITKRIIQFFQIEHLLTSLSLPMSLIIFLMLQINGH